ncbi:hypothetical protein BV25DRAFT_396544 [Artomyces pyxidatus]|uniref:Uncharacterized protein n=1 Tax=Artomyces pyxidatus TaxID=48021 RepID=A0ACB8T4D8_9AGAM|nr:hypothetical protein BV25DRAFT_396544 [Artomyces pyxidatus]
MLRRCKPSSTTLYILFGLAFALLGNVSAVPVQPGSTIKTVLRRQASNPLTQPVTMQTTQTTQTCVHSVRLLEGLTDAFGCRNAGPVTETCVITLTPVTGANGDPLVQEVQQCSVALGSSTSGTSSGSSVSAASAASSATDTTASSATDSSAATSTASASSATASSTDSASATSAASSSDSAATSATASVISFPSVSASASATSAVVSQSAVAVVVRHTPMSI